MSFADVDLLFGSNPQEGYGLLKKRLEAGENDVDGLWRLAKFCHELANQSADDATKKKLILEGRDFATQAYKANSQIFDAIKWVAVLTGKYTDYCGTKEKIEEGANFKKYLDEALAINSNEHSLLHMRGRYSYSVANLSWLERKAAAVFYATPPTATIDEALEDFLAAEKQQSTWIENKLFIARCYLAKGDKANAKKFLTEASQLTPANDSEKELLKEIAKMLAKI